MPLPPGSHTVRICKFTALGDGGEVVASCFEPHPGSDTRAADRDLSVHWLEYFGLGTHSECLARLRQYLLNSPVPREFKPTRTGKLAVLNCAAVSMSARQQLNVPIEFEHMPRLPNTATSIGVDIAGNVVIGIAPQQVANTGQALDPHSRLFTLPEDAAYEFAVQQHLARSVVFIEPGII